MKLLQAGRANCHPCPGPSGMGVFDTASDGPQLTGPVYSSHDQLPRPPGSAPVPFSVRRRRRVQRFAILACSVGERDGKGQLLGVSDRVERAGAGTSPFECRGSISGRPFWRVNSLPMPRSARSTGRRSGGPSARVTSAATAARSQSRSGRLPGAPRRLRHREGGLTVRPAREQDENPADSLLKPDLTLLKLDLTFPEPGLTFLYPNQTLANLHHRRLQDSHVFAQRLNRVGQPREQHSHTRQPCAKHHGHLAGAGPRPRRPLRRNRFRLCGHFCAPSLRDPAASGPTVKMSPRSRGQSTPPMTNFHPSGSVPRPLHIAV